MGHLRSLAVVALAVLSGSAVLNAAPVTVNGASFDAPAACQSAEGALVCKVDGQQLEIWVKRRPLSPDVAATDSFVRKMKYFTELHQAAVVDILRTTSNDAFAQFSNYGKYSALGAAMPGKGVAASPAVLFASVLHEEEIWEFLEVVARRTVIVDSMSADLQKTLVLPAAPPAIPPPPQTPVATAVPAAPAIPPPGTQNRVEGSPLVVAYASKLLSLEHPGYLTAVVLEDSTESVSVTFKHKTRVSGGPTLAITLRPTRDKQATAAIVARERREMVTGTMVGQTASVELNKLGAINGVGFALIGVPDRKKGLSGVESLETTFAADVGDRVLEVRLTAEQQYSSDARVVWAMLAGSIKVGK